MQISGGGCEGTLIFHLFMIFVKNSVLITLPFKALIEIDIQLRAYYKCTAWWIFIHGYICITITNRVLKDKSSVVIPFCNYQRAQHRACKYKYTSTEWLTPKGYTQTVSGLSTKTMKDQVLLWETKWMGWFYLWA